MFESKFTPPRPERRSFTGSRVQWLIEPQQRRTMITALALLLVALGFVLYHDRDFWFPDTDEAEDQPLRPIANPGSAETVTVARATTAQGKQSQSMQGHSSIKAKNPPATKSIDRSLLDRGSIGRSVVALPDSDRTAADLPARDAAVHNTSEDAPPGMTISNRTVLPPLEVEVVAGDARRAVRPGNNSVHVELQSDSASPPPVAASNDPLAASPAGGSPSVPDTAASVTHAAERVQISANTAQVVSRQVQPAYPLLARQMKVQGSVTLRALIGRDGLIQDLRVLNGPPILAGAAEEAVKQWHFKPHYQGADTVETQATITVNFTISTN